VVVEEESIGDEESATVVGSEGLNVRAEDDARSTEQRYTDMVSFVRWLPAARPFFRCYFFAVTLESSHRSVCRLALAGHHDTCVTRYFLSCEPVLHCFFLSHRI
jgi:hypothetical protein